MRCRRPLAVAGALIALAAPAALAHEGNPNYLSTITKAPGVQGLSVEVLNRDDRLALVNRTGREVVVEGYVGEPYARIAADGTVSVNRDSEATYTNEERFGAAVPDGVDSKGPPRWEEVDRSGRFEWHDHRIHWMSKGDPPQAEGATSRVKIYDWSVPLRIAGRPAAIDGVLHWVPDQEGQGVPAGAIAGLGALVLLGAAAVVATRRRRGGAAGTPRADGSDEAW